MKLYNLYEEVILEAKEVLTENVSRDDVIAALNGKYNVNITYDDFPGQQIPPSKRYIQPYALGNTKAGNEALRAYQIFGGTKTEPNGWKIFRLDRIRSWTPTKVRFAQPVSNKGPNIPAYNQNGDRSFTSVSNNVKFNTANNG